MANRNARRESLLESLEMREGEANVKSGEVNEKIRIRLNVVSHFYEKCVPYY